ncbi:hypothetical protein M3C74_00010 [Micrococcus lylae]|uniref:hypothetical protein n=1 Tax=Micrococcus TaxID=1269 RepID=UPI0008A3FC9A|nr:MULTISPECIES: hypothetical protein [Micrococcus]MCT2006273.1 hypothetical protein [Micrococcus lylae]MCT2070226.1 hypothetical protein [Micrococcus lylae]OFR90964.1 hypothetical protein HMPREF2863_05585 [Micrococcus sp. HMSC067E09]
MSKSAVKTLVVVALVVLGVLTLFLRNQGYLTDTAASLTTAVLLVVAFGAYFVVERLYRKRKRVDS